MTMTARVFVVQRPAVRVQMGWVDKYDLSPAEHFGRLVEILPRGNVPRLVGPTIGRLESALTGFSSEDYLLAVGDPVAIAAAAIIAARESTGKVRLLKWDKRHGEYTVYELDLRM